jgi:hypothetical protein
MEKCIDKLIDNLSTRRMKIYGGVNTGDGNVGTGNYLFDPYVDDNSTGGPEGFSSDVSELKEAVDYIIANAPASGFNRDYYWCLRPIQLVAAS